MKIARFSAQERPQYGILDAETQELVALKGDPLFSGFETTGARYPLAEVKLLSPVIPRSKVVGLGGTYVPAGQEKPSEPAPAFVFMKPNTAVIGPDDPIVIPAYANKVTLESELAVVIGKLCKDLSPAQAPEAIFGYTVANDLCTDVDSRGEAMQPGYFAQGKSFDTGCPLGPFIDLDVDPDNLHVRSRLNGKPLQDASTSTLIMPVAQLVSWVSHCFTLLPGDVIVTGTPAGATTAQAGDVIEVEISEIGVLRNPVVKR